MDSNAYPISFFSSSEELVPTKVTSRLWKLAMDSNAYPLDKH